jgi:hypothetical protein
MRADRLQGRLDRLQRREGRLEGRGGRLDNRSERIEGREGLLGARLDRFNEDEEYDEGEGGRFEGRGPKNWKRSDERIREDVNEELARHPWIDASEIEVRVANGEVTLTGTVNNRIAKRRAEEVAEHVFGATDVQNQIRVKREPLSERFGEREVTRTPDRESRTGTTEETRKTTGTATTGTGTTSAR